MAIARYWIQDLKDEERNVTSVQCVIANFHEYQETQAVKGATNPYSFIPFTIRILSRKLST